MLGYKIWHKSLIKCLPNNMLLILYQNLADYACNPNVPKKTNPYKSKMSEFNKSHFYNYCCEVYNELSKRDISDFEMQIVDEYSMAIKLFVSDEEKQIGASISFKELFSPWMTNRYYHQCYYALEEMYDYGLIDQKWFNKISTTYRNED